MKKTILLIILVYSTTTYTQIIDVVTGIHWPGQMETVGNELYFIEYAEHNILKINITDPNPDPVLVYHTGDWTMDIEIQGDRLFYTIYGGDTIYEIDLSDPTPTATQFVTGLVATDGLFLNNTDLYVSERSPGNKISKVNINDPNPSLELVVEIGSPRTLWLEGDILYIGAYDGEQIMKINIIDPNPSPVLVVNPSGITSGLMVYEDQIYLSYFFQDQISKYDTTNGLEVQIDQEIDAPTGMLVIGEDLYFSQYNADKISKVDINSLPLILGLTENDIKKLFIYPNPASDYLSFEGLNEQIQTRLYDINGHIIKSPIIKPFERFSIADLSSGIYFLEFDGFKILKFIKK